MTNLTSLTLCAAKEGLLKKHFTSVELTQAHIDAIEKNKNLNAYITCSFDRALDQARKADARYATGESQKLDGLPLGIKDLFCTKDIRTTAGSHSLYNFIPPYESTVTQNLLNEGAVFLGKLNMDEFAMGSANLNSAFGPCLSPWSGSDNPGHPTVPGGSSGGSSAAVAADLALATTGSDTGGSIRQPAAFTGTVGIKPTYGLCSRYGMVAFASSLDQAGPITKTVKDAALMLEVMASFDEKDSTSLNVKIPHYADNISSDIQGLRVGIVKEYVENLKDDAHALFDRGMAWLKDAGCTFVDISLPTTPYALPTYYILAPAEASANLARYDGLKYGRRVEGSGLIECGQHYPLPFDVPRTLTLDEMYAYTRRYGFGDEVRRRVMIGTYVLSAGYFDAYYVKAQKIQTLIKQDFDNAFAQVDVLLTPTTPTDAFTVDNPPTDPVTMYMNDIFTVTTNLAGLPAISVPAGVSKRHLPLGLQIIGPHFSEQTLFNVAQVIEDAANFKASFDHLKTIHG